jgi:hypothetical protein
MANTALGKNLAFFHDGHMRHSMGVVIYAIYRSVRGDVPWPKPSSRINHSFTNLIAKFLIIRAEGTIHQIFNFWVAAEIKSLLIPAPEKQNP